MSGCERSLLYVVDCYVVPSGCFSIFSFCLVAAFHLILTGFVGVLYVVFIFAAPQTCFCLVQRLTSVPFDVRLPFQGPPVASGAPVFHTPLVPRAATAA